MPLPALVPQRVPELPPLEGARPLPPVDAVVPDVVLDRLIIPKPLEALLPVARRAARPHEARVAAHAHLGPAAVPQTVPDLPELRELVERHADAAPPRRPRVGHRSRRPRWVPVPLGVLWRRCAASGGRALA